MNKERLEKIIKQVKRSDEYAEKGLWAVSDKRIVNLHNEGHIYYLIEQVKELEKANKTLSDNHFQQIEQHKYLVQQNKRYRDALEQDSRQEVIESLYEDKVLLKQEVKDLKREIEQEYNDHKDLESDLLNQNKRYREALSFVESELYEVLHENKELNVKMFRIENAKRMITKVLNEEDDLEDIWNEYLKLEDEG